MLLQNHICTYITVNNSQILNVDTFYNYKAENTPVLIFLNNFETYL